jgi:hypothetical protein
MSVIRFLHTDALRLGSPIAGLAESPDWLRKVAASAVRMAVTNLIEAAIAGRCHLVYVTGRLTESDQDLDLAVSWFAGATASLKDHGIRLALAGYSEAEFPALRRLDALLIGSSQRLEGWSAAGDRIEFAVTERALPARTGSLAIECATMASMRPHADLAYLAVPAIQASALTNSFDGVASAYDRHLRLSAGCPQALQSTERGAFGCQIVEADLMRQSLTSRFTSTDVLRFSQELVTCRPGTTLAQLCDLIGERSRAIATSGRRTTVVDWVIDGQLSVTGGEALGEIDLLRTLRSHLHAGHSGAWPSRIRFSENSLIELVGSHPIAVHEFAAVVRDRMTRSGRTSAASLEAGSTGLPIGGTSEAAVAVSLLRRAA